MGGNAFAASLNPASFPRMPPRVYAALKARLLPPLQALYRHVDVPHEVPEKTSHGDLDIIVADPLIRPNGDSTDVSVAHGIVRRAIGAQYVIPMQGNRTSNFAVPVAEDEWRASGHGEEEDNARRAVDGRSIFYQERCLLIFMPPVLTTPTPKQVDINVCADKAEFDRVVFFHSYGDLGMIMSLIARNLGLRLGEKGLRMPNGLHPPIELSQSFEDITKFMGWSMERWRAGFQTKTEAFEWAISTAFFKPETFRTHGKGLTKVGDDRVMYTEFVEWVSEKGFILKGNVSIEEQNFRERVLAYFNKTDTVVAEMQNRSSQGFRKQIWNGKKVNEWAELEENWKSVKLIMDVVRERLGGDKGVQNLYEEEGEGAVQKIVLEVKGQLSLDSSTQ